MTPDITLIFQQSSIHLFVKIVFLVLIGLFLIFSLMIANKIRSFNKILFLPSRSGGSLMQSIAIVYSFVVFVLFVLAMILL